MTRLRGVGIAMAVAASLSAAGRQQPTFRARVNLVRIDALVAEKGRPVRGLGAADFDVRDNGVQQHIDFVSGDSVPLDAVLALDMSESVDYERRTNLQRAGHALIDGLRNNDRTALITFTDAVTVRMPVTTDFERARQELDLLRAMGGGTALIDATYAGMLLADRDEGRAALIVFSDGLDTLSWLEAQTVLDSAKAANVVVYSVVVGKSPRPPFLRDLSASTGGRLFQVESTSNLTRVFVAALEEFRQRYLIGYTPSGVSTTGWHQITVRVKGRSLDVTARKGYQAGRGPQ